MNEFDKGWIVGLIEQNGSFTLNKIVIARKTDFGGKIYRYENPIFFLTCSDRTPVEAARQILGMGKISKHGKGFHLAVRRKKDCLRLIEFLEGKLRSEVKKRQFEAWRERVLQWKSRGRRIGIGNSGGVSSTKEPPQSRDLKNADLREGRT